MNPTPAFRKKKLSIFCPASPDHPLEDPRTPQTSFEILETMLPLTMHDVGSASCLKQHHGRVEGPKVLIYKRKILDDFQGFLKFRGPSGATLTAEGPVMSLNPQAWLPHRQRPVVSLNSQAWQMAPPKTCDVPKVEVVPLQCLSCSSVQRRHELRGHRLCVSQGCLAQSARPLTLRSWVRAPWWVLVHGLWTLPHAAGLANLTWPLLLP